MRSAELPRIRFAAALSLLVACVALAGCTTATPSWFLPEPPKIKPERVRLSYIATADLRAASQLGPGWYEIEEGAWRWMAREATVYLKRPQGNNLVFEAKLYVPPNLVRTVGSTSLEILVNGGLLAREHLSHPGEHLIRHPVSPDYLRSEIVRVDLKLDRAMPPSGADKRELGAVVTAVGLRPAAGSPGLSD